MTLEVGIVTTSFPRYQGDAAGSFVAQLVEALRDQGASVRVVAPAPAESGAAAPEGVTYAAPRMRAAREIAYGDGVVENLRRRPQLVPLLPSFVGALTRTARSELANCDVLDACFTVAGLCVRRARRPGQALLYSAHGTDVHLLDRSALYRALFLRLLGGFDHVTAVSEYLEAKLRRHGYPGELSVVGNGVAAEAFELRRTRTDPPSVVYAGRLLSGKRPDLLLHAWPGVLQEAPGSRLHVFGEGPLEAPLRDLARSLRVEDSVVFHGRVPQTAVWEAVAAASLFVMPSEEEGLPTGVVEALALGTPFVASRCGAEIARGTSSGTILEEPLTAEMLSRAIRRSLRDTDALAVAGGSGRRAASERYSWGVIAKQKLAAYERAIAAARRRRGTQR